MAERTVGDVYPAWHSAQSLLSTLVSVRGWFAASVVSLEPETKLQ